MRNKIALISLTLIMISGTAYCALTDNIISYWKLDETSGNAVDATGNGHTGTVTTATQGVSGKIGNAVNFTGSGNIVAPNVASLQMGLNSFTFAFWINCLHAPYAGNNGGVIGGDSGAAGFVINTSTYMYLTKVYPDSAYAPQYSQLVPLNQWTFIAVTYNASNNNVTYYMNNLTPETYASTISSFDATAATDRLGEWANGSGDPYFGKLDEVGMWSRVLSAGEISQLYNSGSGLTYPFVTTPTTSLYRSVGYNNTSNLNTGNTVTIVSTTATFSGAMPNNVGVGDCIVYGSSVAFICGRIDSANFAVQSSSGGIPPATSSYSASVYRSYISLANWNGNTTVNTGITGSGISSSQVVLPSKNLTTLNAVMMVPCYADATDPTGVAESGWTTDSNHYVKIYTPISSAEVGASQRHNGTWGSGFMITGYLTIGDNYVQVDGLSVYQSANNHTIYVGGQTTAGLVQISDCFAWYTNSAAQYPFDDYSISSALTIEWWNCIGISTSTSASAAAFYFNGGSNVAAYAYNCTGICPTGYAFNRGTVSSAALKNCLGQGKGTGVTNFGNFSSGDLNYCASRDASATSFGGSGNRSSQTFVFVSSATNNYLITGTDAGARDFGTNLSADPVIPFSYDICGDTRPLGAFWDIGAYEATPVVSTITCSGGLVGYWKLDESAGTPTAIDSSGYGNNAGTVTVTTQGYSPGKIGKCVYFAAGNKHVIWPNNAYFNIYTSSCAFTAWVYCTQWPSSGNGGGIIGGSANGAAGLYINETGNLMFGSIGLNMITTSLVVPINQWTFVAATFDGPAKNMVVYMNNTPETHNGVGFNFNNGVYTDLIGEIVVGSGDPWYGYIDEVGIWKGTILTPAQIANIYNNGTGVTYPFDAALTNVNITSPVSSTGLGYTYNPHPWIVFNATDTYQLSSARIQIATNTAFVPVTTDYWSSDGAFGTSFITLPCYSTNSIRHTLNPNGTGLALGATWYVRALVQNAIGQQSPGWSNTSAVRLSTMTAGMTDAITDGTTRVRAAHFLELQTAINNVRALRGSGAFSWDSSWSTLGTGSLIRIIHLNDLRNALKAPFKDASGSNPVYTSPDPITSGSLIRGVHIRELRADTTSYP